MRSNRHFFQWISIQRLLLCLLLVVILAGGMLPGTILADEAIWEDDFSDEEELEEYTEPEVPESEEELYEPELAEMTDETWLPESADERYEMQPPVDAEIIDQRMDPTEDPEPYPEEAEFHEEEESYYLDEILETAVELVHAEGTVYDVLYNAYELGLLPAIRNQSPYGDCWAFAGIGSLETDLIADANADPAIDLSEYYLAYFVTHMFPYPKGGADGDSILYTGTSSFLDNGGNNYMVMRMLANLIGTVNEEDAPYPDGTDELPPVRYVPATVQITGAYMIDASDRDAVKQAILDHGAVSASINMVTQTREYPGGYTASFQSNGDRSCLFGDYNVLNHEVMLVGWDDDFEISNFSEDIRPSAPGAWLARNSWGYEGYGYNGYFWISYYDASLLKNKTTAYDAINDGLSDFCYSYDKTPYPASRYLYSDQATVRQRFPVDGQELLQAVGVETASDHVRLTVSVQRDGVEIASGTALADYEGFYRILLDIPYELIDPADVEIEVTYTSLAEGGTVRVPFAPAGESIQGQIRYVNASGDGGFWFNNRHYEGDSRLKLYTKKLAMEQEVEVLSLSEEYLPLLSGERVQLTAQLTPADPANPRIRWFTSDPRVAQVDENGIVIAGSVEGTAVVTAMTDRGICADCLIETTFRNVAVLKSANVEFDGLIHLLFTYDLTGIREQDRDRLCIAFRSGGELWKKCSLNDFLETYTQEKEDGTHTLARYTCPVPIADYLAPINIRTEDADGQEIYTVTGSGVIVQGGYTYALNTYAEHKIRHGSAAMQRMAQALKNYGLAALRYIGADTEGQTVSPAVAGFDVVSVEIHETETTGQKPEGVTVSQSVIFESDNSLQVTWRLPEGKDASDYLFEQDGARAFPEAETDPETGDRYVTLRVADIAPDHLNDLHSFRISDGSDEFSVATSVLGYAKRKAQRGSADMRILAKALCNYYVETLRYID